MEAEPPECPVCMQIYDDVSAIPRVLSCGHTTCEVCLKQLPRPFTNTIRCTICTLLVKFPNSPSSLPKNIDLLHFSSVLQHRHPIKEKNVISPSSPPKIGEYPSVIFTSTLKSWSFELYRTWKKWILPKDCIVIENVSLDHDCGVVDGKVFKSFESDHMIGCALRGKENVSLIKVGIFVEREEDSMFFKSSYESRIMTVLCGMKEAERSGLGIILNATHRVSNVGKAYGFWYNEDDKCVYVVWEKLSSPDLMECVLKKKEDEMERLSAEEIIFLGMVGMETCEILSCLHLKELIIGFLSLSCFSFSDFGHVHLDLSEVLSTGRRVNLAVGSSCRDLNNSSKNDLLDLNFVFISPEMLLKLVVKEGFELDPQISRYEVGSASDVWCVACLLVWVIVGSSFVEDVKSFSNVVFSAIKDEKDSDFSGLYTRWVEKVVALLEGRLGLTYATLQKILCRCLGFEPGNRPVITELWKCLRELVIEPKFDMGLSSKQEIKKENLGHSVVLGDVCLIVEESVKDTGDEDDVEPRVERDVIDGISRGNVKCVEMKGHLDCVTGLAIGGGFLFSSSYDKIVHVWSLHDYSLVHSFKGHEHRVTSVVFVDGEQPMCISGDNEGIICIWEASYPFPEEPIKKLYENKDWRYSGIHAMAISGNEYLYTGSGDKLVKAWSLQDYSVSCAMSGHKSVVSCLNVCGGVLYSGSWDGSVRLWSLSDHSPLAVLEQDNMGKVVPVLCLSSDHDLLLVGHENGTIRVWCNDVLVKTIDTHKGAVFSVSKTGKLLFSGGWDKTISVEEISGDIDEMDVTSLGSIVCNSTITALMYRHGKLFVGQADRTIKVYHGV
ncbi:hypothetical protein ACS0TY_007276 [Phlomoides rotata]